jgi:hypothetical protein
MLVGATGVAGANTAQTATAPLKEKVALTGTKGFKGTYTIQRFISKGNKLYAVGTLTGKTKGGKRVTKQNVRIPATLAGGQGAQASQVPPIIPTQGACQILSLNLGAIDLNLLGVRVRTNPINLLIEAVPGAGNLLGNLLCAVTNLLNPGGALPGGGLPVNQVAALLSAILALLGGLGG